MITLLRHLLAIAVLPFTVLVLVPYWIAERYGVAPALGHSVGPVFLQVVGLALLGLGLGLIALGHLLPYLADRLLAPRLPGLAATLVFPAALVTAEQLGSWGPMGSWGATA